MSLLKIENLDFSENLENEAKSVCGGYKVPKASTAVSVSSGADSSANYFIYSTSKGFVAGGVAAGAAAGAAAAAVSLNGVVFAGTSVSVGAST